MNTGSPITAWAFCKVTWVWASICLMFLCPLRKVNASLIVCFGREAKFSPSLSNLPFCSCDWILGRGGGEEVEEEEREVRGASERKVTQMNGWQ